MALGRKIIEWNYADIAKGESSSTELGDAGYSPTTDGGNSVLTPGVIFNPPAPITVSNSLSGQMIASCEDPTGHYARIFTSSDTDQDGRFWSMDGSYVLTIRGSEDTSHNYVSGKTDMIAFDGEAFITTDQTVVRWSDIGVSNTFDTAFFTFNNTLAPHPALAFNNFAYYGDGNLLRRQATASTVPVTILTLAAGVIIVALGIDPGSGSMLLSLIGQINLSDTINSGARIAFYDGFSAQVLRYVQVDDMVTAFAPTEGALYCGYGQNFGIWNGSGITFLRRMELPFNNNNLLYKQHFTSIGSTLFFIENARIVAYGPVRQKGDQVFYPVLTNTVGADEVSLTHIANVGSNNMVMSWATSQFAHFDWIGTNATPQNITSNSYNFDDEEWVRRGRIMYQNLVPNGSDPGDLLLYNEEGLLTETADNGVYNLVNDKGFSSAFKDINNINLRLKELTFKLALNNINMPSQVGDVNTASAHGSTTTLPISHTVPTGLSNSYILALVSSSTGTNVSGTVGGSAMTKVSFPTGNYQANLLYFANPPAGANSVVINWSVGATEVGVTLLTVKDSGIPTFNNEYDGTGASVTGAVTNTLQRTLYIEFTVSAATTHTPNTGQTELSNFTIATSNIQVSSSSKPAPYPGTNLIGETFGGSVTYQINILTLPPASTPLNPGIRRVIFYGDEANKTGSVN